MSLSWTSLQNEEVTGTNPIGTGEARDSERIPICCPVNVSHGDETRRKMIQGRVLNMSSSGVLVEAPRPMAVGSQVRVRANELLVGTAYVRHSTRRSWRFRIGLEFATPVRNRY
jgi:hypothetical protein